MVYKDFLSEQSANNWRYSEHSESSPVSLAQHPGSPVRYERVSGLHRSPYVRQTFATERYRELKLAIASRLRGPSERYADSCSAVVFSSTPESEYCSHTTWSIFSQHSREKAAHCRERHLHEEHKCSGPHHKKGVQVVVQSKRVHLEQCRDIRNLERARGFHADTCKALLHVVQEKSTRPGTADKGCTALVPPRVFTPVPVTYVTMCSFLVCLYCRWVTRKSDWAQLTRLLEAQGICRDMVQQDSSTSLTQ